MVFHEIYGIYYKTVARILKEALDHNLTEEEMNAVVKEIAFDESFLNIPKSLGKEHWQLIKENGESVVKNIPTMPLTTLQKRWINAIALDPRIRLFTATPFTFSDVKPLFLQDDICVFDKYLDGDPYEDEKYIHNFRIILDAIKGKEPIQIKYISRHGEPLFAKTIPQYLEYSEKDDKFRLIGTESKLGHTINLSKIISCKKCEGIKKETIQYKNYLRPRTVIFELRDNRNALERVLMHFSHFEKQIEKSGIRKYKITLHYDKEDETEVLIRVLSFGPVIRVIKPVRFVELIKERLEKQKSCGLK